MSETPASLTNRKVRIGLSNLITSSLSWAFEFSAPRHERSAQVSKFAAWMTSHLNLVVEAAELLTQLGIADFSLVVDAVLVLAGRLVAGGQRRLDRGPGAAFFDRSLRIPPQFDQLSGKKNNNCVK